LFEEKIGDLLEAKEDYIAHICCCSHIKDLAVGQQPNGIIPSISRKIFSRFPSSYIYRDGMVDELIQPGSINIRGRIIALFAQHYNNKILVNHDDFVKCLGIIGQLNPRPKSIAFPHSREYGLDDGNQTQYKSALKDFATISGIKVVTYHKAGF